MTMVDNNGGQQQRDNDDEGHRDTDTMMMTKDMRFVVLFIIDTSSFIKTNINYSILLSL